MALMTGSVCEGARVLAYSDPGLLFPALALLMMGYTNRYLGIIERARELAQRYRMDPQPGLRAQIDILRRRIVLVRRLQAVGVGSLLACTACMLALFLGLQGVAHGLFAAALVLMVGSLLISLYEIHLSVRALDIELASVPPALESR